MSTYSLQDAIDALEQRGCQPKPTGDQWQAFCPVHEISDRGHKPSLSVKAGDQQPFVVYCHAGCSAKQIVDALGLTPKPTAKTQRKLVATYDYHDAEGRLVSQKVRYEPKDFQQRWPDGAGGWIWKKAKCPTPPRNVLYRLPKLLEAKAAGCPVFIVEGEKDADRLFASGLSVNGSAATTSIEGASKDTQRQKWKVEYTEQLAGAARVVLVPDNDTPGRAHMVHIARQLKGKVSKIHWLELPGLPDKGDVSDWLNQGHTVAELLELADAAPDAEPITAPGPEETKPNSTRPATIFIEAGEFPEAADQAEVALIQHDASIYQRSGYLCRVAHLQPATVRNKITRPAGAVMIAAMDKDCLLDKLNRSICWMKWNEKKEDYKRCHAPPAVAMTLLARSGFWNFPQLIGVITAPTLRPDGSILDKPGYDEVTGLFFDHQNIEFLPTPERPTWEQARAALSLLNDEILNRPCINSDRPEDQGFSFAAPSDRSAALAAILTALVRHSLPTAPLFLFSATRQGSAKSLLANAVSLLATGRSATIFELGKDTDEIEKRMLSILMAGDAVVNLDNLEIPLGGATLCKVMTGETITGRILGLSKTATVPTITTWLATGNNASVVGDMTRRVIVCNLDPVSEYPQNRQYDRNLDDWIPANRPRLVQAALTVLKAYSVASHPRQAHPLMGSFEDWDRTVRSALTWLGEADPLSGTEQLEENDPTKTKLRTLLMAWFAAFRTAGATSKEAIAKARETVRNEEGDEIHPAQALFDVLEEHFTDKRGEISSRIIGEFLKRYVRRVEIGARFEEYGSSQHRQVWRVKILDPQRWRKFFSEGNSTHQTHQTHKQGFGRFSESGESGESASPHAENFAEKFNAAPARDRGEI